MPESAVADPVAPLVEEIVAAPEGFQEATAELFGLERQHVELYVTMKMLGDEKLSLQEKIFAKTETAVGFASGQSANPGRQQHPYDKGKVLSMVTANEYHSACLETKVASIVGLGFKLDTQEKSVAKGDLDALILTLAKGEGITWADLQARLVKAGAVPAPQPQQGLNIRPVGERLKSKVDVTLDPLCMFSWADVLNSVCMEYCAAGDGYIEVVRTKADDKVVGLHRLPSPNVYINVNQAKTDFWYEVTMNGSTRRFARWGRAKTTQFVKDKTIISTFENGTTYSEVIHFRKPNALSVWYGVAGWISAIPTIELLQLLRQYKFDFFLNRGVPEFFLFLLGSKLPKDKWAQLENAIRSTVGTGNSRKSVVMNILDKEMQIKMEKMATEKAGDDNFAATSDSLNLSIVTAHRVPPLLAGIQVPGKLGAANELINTLMGFQALVVGQDQRVFLQTLIKTLGSKEAGLSLAPTDFDLYTILEEIDINAMSTVGQMRQPLPEAQAQGRDLGAGLKKGEGGAS